MPSTPGSGPVQRGTPPRQPTFQPALFSSKDLPQVLPIESFSPRGRRPPQRPRDNDRRSHREIPDRQQVLDIYADPGEPVRYTNAPVAVVSHRVTAAALDLSMVLIAVVFFLILLQFLPGPIRLDRQAMIVYLALSSLVLVFYKLLWCLADADPPGMRWTNLQLMNFDGRPPNRNERLLRLGAGCLSVMPAGVGILWVLVDEESLSWHDHISKTFASPIYNP
ncbi:MAG: RDD family protein [Bryobacteraceae bacterium]